MDVKLHVDLETLQLILGPGQRSAVTSLRFKRGDAARLQVVFLENGVSPATIGDPGLLQIQFGIKPRNQFSRSYLAHGSEWTMPSEGDDAPAYECSISFNTLQLDSALNVGSATAEELPEITLMGEITWREGAGEPTSTRTFLVVVENDVNRGTEGVPVSAEPPYPPPGDLVTNANLGNKAVRHDTAQNLTADQKTQARANIGAIGDIANGSLSIAKTSGLQSALNGKAPINHTHEIDSVNNLQLALNGKLGFKLGVAPGELNGGDTALPWILKKDSNVWLYDPNTGATALVDGTTPPPSGLEIQAHFVTATGGSSESTTSIEVPAGSYLVTITAANFTTASWGSHSLAIPYLDYIASFSNPSPGSLYDMQVTTGPGNLYFYLADPSMSSNPQIGTVNLYLSSALLFYVSGYLPMDGDSVDLNITFTPI